MAARTGTPGDPVREGWTALDRGAWEAARRCFEAALAEGEEPVALEGLAWAAWWLNDAPTVFASRERAFHRFRERDAVVDAARQAIWLGCDHHDFRGEHAVANGWYQRARRLLAGLPAVVEHGWLAFHEGAYALELEDDTATAKERAAEAARVADAVGYPDLAFLSLALEGLALVTEGAVDDGMRRLDEAGVAATSGEVRHRIATTWTLCYLIYACERARDFGRAAEWCRRMEEISTRFAFELGIGVCRAHYGAVLVLHGDWTRAERELREAEAALARARPPVVIEAIPVESASQRADALELAARARALTGDVDDARAAATELTAIAGAVGTKPLRAMAACAEGTVASAAGDDRVARRCFEQAAELFDGSGLPYEEACARIELATVLGRLGRDEAARAQATLSAARLRALGAPAAARRAEHVVTGGPPTPRSPIDGLSPREVEVLALLAEGSSDRQIAQRMSISTHTVHRHVSNIFTKLGVSSRAAAAAIAARHGIG